MNNILPSTSVSQPAVAVYAEETGQRALRCAGRGPWLHWIEKFARGTTKIGLRHYPVPWFLKERRYPETYFWLGPETCSAF